MGVGGQERRPGTGLPAAEVALPALPPRPPPPRPSRKGRHRTLAGRRGLGSVVCLVHRDRLPQTMQILPKSLSPVLQPPGRCWPTVCCDGKLGVVRGTCRHLGPGNLDLDCSRGEDPWWAVAGRLLHVMVERLRLREDSPRHPRLRRAGVNWALVLPGLIYHQVAWEVDAATHPLGTQPEEGLVRPPSWWGRDHLDLSPTSVARPPSPPSQLQGDS